MADNYSSKEQDLISNLPNEVLVHILKNLDYCHFLAVRHVSTRFNILSNSLFTKRLGGFALPATLALPPTDTNLDRHLILG